MIQHYIHDSCTPEWLREQLAIEREATIDGEYDHEYVSGLKPRVEDGQTTNDRREATV